MCISSFYTQKSSYFAKATACMWEGLYIKIVTERNDCVGLRTHTERFWRGLLLALKKA